MSQHDLNIANQGFPAFRADLNDALVALGSTNSGATAPATTFANQLWYDTANNILKIRNEDNDAWISILTLDQSTDTVSSFNSAVFAATSGGSASAPAISTTGDTNTGIFFPAADTIAFTEGGVESVRITSAGLVGIGTASPSALLTVQKSQNTDTQIQLVNADGGTAATARFDIVDNASSFLSIQNFSQGYSGSFWGVTAAKLKVIFDNSAPTFSNGLMLGTSGSTPLYFATAATQRMIITSAGNIGIGTTSPSDKLEVVGQISARRNAGGYVFRFLNSSSESEMSGFIYDNNQDNIEITAFDPSYALAFKTNNIERMRISSAGTITFTQTTLASYKWDAWNPTNVSGTTTNAPSTGTTNDSNYVTMSNSSGTLTATFDIAGKYLICVNSAAGHAAAYSYDRVIAYLGGSATRQIGDGTIVNHGDPAIDSNFNVTTSFYLSATAAQTLTILPTYELTGSGTAGQHTAYCHVTIQYCGA